MHERTQFKAIKTSNKENSEPHHELAGASKAVRSFISRSEVNVHHLRTTKTHQNLSGPHFLLQTHTETFVVQNIFEVFIASNN